MAGLVPTLPPVPVPVVPVAPQTLPLPPFQPAQLLPQPGYAAPRYYGPGFTQPQAPPQPRPRQLQSTTRWHHNRNYQRSATGTANLKKLRKKNRDKTQQAFGPAAGGFANTNRPVRSRFRPPAARNPAGGRPGVQHNNTFKKPWKPRYHRRPLPARAQTPSTILRTPATVQRTPAVVQQTPAGVLPGQDSQLEGTPPLSGHRQRRRLSQDPDMLLLGDGAGAGLDFFGTNQGLIMRRSASLSSSTGSEADDSGSDSEPANDYELCPGLTAAAPLPKHVQAHLDDQADQIAQLEVDNTRLSDENINLRERIFLLEKEMAELRHIGGASTEEDIPPQWFGMAESDFVDEEGPSAAAVSPVAMQDAQQASLLASPANATPSSQAPVMIDIQ